VNILLDKRNENAVVDIRGPYKLRRKDQRIAVTFRAKVRFEAGHVLEIADHFQMESSGDEWVRQFSYFFGLSKNDETKRVFLFDTHGLYGPAHLDLGDDERLSVGDPRLKGFSPEDVNVIDVCNFVDLYFDGKPFPWDECEK